MSSTKPNKFTIVLVCFIGAVVALMLWFLSARNNLVGLDESINGHWAQVENQLQRRYDLIPNLVNTVKGYASHEKDVFSNIAQARAQLAGARSTTDKIGASQRMESALSRLLVIAENYPQLKADAQFTRLMDELAGSENRLSVERKKFNDTVQLYNATIRRFPGSIVASLAHFSQKDYFKVEDAAKGSPKVQF